MDNIPTNSKRIRRISAKYKNDYQILYGNKSISLNLQLESTALPQRLLNYYHEIIFIFISQLKHRFLEESWAVVITEKILLSRETKTVDTFNMLYSLLSRNIYDSNNINAELNVLYNGLLQYT